MSVWVLNPKSEPDCALQAVVHFNGWHGAQLRCSKAVTHRPGQPRENHKYSPVSQRVFGMQVPRHSLLPLGLVHTHAGRIHCLQIEHGAAQVDEGVPDPAQRHNTPTPRRAQGTAAHVQQTTRETLRNRNKTPRAVEQQADKTAGIAYLDDSAPGFRNRSMYAMLDIRRGTLDFRTMYTNTGSISSAPARGSRGGSQWGMKPGHAPAWQRGSRARRETERTEHSRSTTRCRSHLQSRGEHLKCTVDALQLVFRREVGVHLHEL